VTITRVDDEGGGPALNHTHTHTSKHTPQWHHHLQIWPFFNKNDL